MDQNAAGGTTILAGIPEAGVPDSSGGRAEIGVREDNDWSFAAELQVDALHGLCGGFRNGLATDNAARQRHQGDVGVLRKSLPDRPSPTGDDVQDAIGDASGHEFGQL
ncbi:hypothetical protein D9M72_452990 [compost metagenome]